MAPHVATPAPAHPSDHTAGKTPIQLRPSAVTFLHGLGLISQFPSLSNISLWGEVINYSHRTWDQKRAPGFTVAKPTGNEQMESLESIL